MSAVSNPDLNVTRQDLADFYDKIFPYLGGRANAGFTPVGTVISVMGVDAPTHYLKCDGTVYNIADYPELATYFGQQFSMINKFGGDGTTTFAVPDLRGEFLRGTGTNSHSNGGNGSAVGAHQDPTYHPNLGVSNGNSASKGHLVSFVSDNDTAYNNTVYLQDKSLTRLPSGETSATQPITKYAYASTSTATTSATHAGFASRPTNTSVLWCIATKNIYMNPSLDYSTDEKVVGSWIDGKTIYQRTFVDTAPSTATDGTLSEKYITIGASIDKVMSIKSIRESSGYAWGEFPLTNPPTITTDTISSKTVVTSVKNLMMMAFVFDNNATSNANKIRVTNNCVAWSDIPIYITIQYTKTT